MQAASFQFRRQLPHLAALVFVLVSTGCSFVHVRFNPVPVGANATRTDPNDRPIPVQHVQTQLGKVSLESGVSPYVARRQRVFEGPPLIPFIPSSSNSNSAMFDVCIRVSVDPHNNDKRYGVNAIEQEIVTDSGARFHCEYMVVTSENVMPINNSTQNVSGTGPAEFRLYFRGANMESIDWFDLNLRYRCFNDAGSEEDLNLSAVRFDIDRDYDYTPFFFAIPVAIPR